MDYDDEAIHTIYQAANEPEYWKQAAETISEISGGGAVHLLLASLETGQEYVNLFTRDQGGGFADEYIRDYASSDFRVPRVMARPLGDFTDEREYVSKDEARFSAIHQELLPRYDVYNISGANMCLDGCIGWFGISTPRPGVDFDSRQTANLRRLSRHVLNACRISMTHQDLMIARDQALGPLDLINAGLFLVESGRIVHMNEAAKSFIAEGFFRARNDRLYCADRAANDKFAMYLKQAAQRAMAPLLLRQPERDAAYSISVNDLFPRYEEGRVQKSRYQVISLVELNIPASTDLDEVLAFCSAYGVSAAEAMTIHASLSSISLVTFAEKRRIALNTAQKQLKSALSKMGISNQKKLFRAFERYRIVSRDRLRSYTDDTFS